MNGTTAFHIIKALCNYGFDAVGVKAESILDENILFTCYSTRSVKKMACNIFVVVYKNKTKKYIHLMDPAKGKVKMSIQEFLDIWDNILILITPSSNILNYTKELSIVGLFGKLLMKHKYLFLK